MILHHLWPKCAVLASMKSKYALCRSLWVNKDFLVSGYFWSFESNAGELWLRHWQLQLDFVLSSSQGMHFPGCHS
jgi:hypothetical protein